MSKGEARPRAVTTQVKISRMCEFALLIVFILSASTVAAESNDLATVIQQTCAQYHGVEYREARKTTVLNQKGTDTTEDCTVVLFTVEMIDGGNYSYQFLCVLKRLPVPPRRALVYLQQIGGKGIRVIDRLTAGRDEVEISGLEYGPSDPMSLPSIPCIFKLTCRNGIFELRAQNSPSERVTV